MMSTRCPNCGRQVGQKAPDFEPVLAGHPDVPDVPIADIQDGRYAVCLGCNMLLHVQDSRFRVVRQGERVPEDVADNARKIMRLNLEVRTERHGKN